MSVLIDRSDTDYYTIEESDDGLALRALKGTEVSLTPEQAEEALGVEGEGVVGDVYVIEDGSTGQGDLMFYSTRETEDGETVRDRHLVNVHSDDLAGAIGAVSA